MNKTLLSLLAAASLALGLLAPAQATVLTFDDIAAGTLTTYNGFNWTNASVAKPADFGGFQGVAQGLVSGDQVLLNPNFGTTIIASTTAFSLNSGYFTSWNGHGIDLTVVGYLGGIQQGFGTYQISDQISSLINFDQSVFGNVDSVTFSNYAGFGTFGDSLVIDNLRVNDASSGRDVPEPASIGLLGLGLLGLAAARRKRA